MFDNAEIKKLRQDTDALSEQIEKLIETQEVRHADIMNKLELIEQKLEQEGEDVTEKMEEIRAEIEEVKDTATSIDTQLEEK